MSDQKTSIDYVRSRQETARILGVSVRTLRRMEVAGLLRPTQITQRIRGFRDSVINQFIQSRTAA